MDVITFCFRVLVRNTKSPTRQKMKRGDKRVGNAQKSERGDRTREQEIMIFALDA